MQPVGDFQFVCQKPQPLLIRALACQRQMPARLVSQELYRGIETLVRMQSCCAAEQHMIEWQLEPLPRYPLRQIERLAVKSVGDVFHARAIEGGVARIFALHVLRIERYE